MAGSGCRWQAQGKAWWGCSIPSVSHLLYLGVPLPIRRPLREEDLLERLRQH